MAYSNSTIVKNGNGTSYTLAVSWTEIETSTSANTSTISISASLGATQGAFSVSNAGTLSIYWHDNNKYTSDTYVNSITISQCGNYGQYQYGTKSVSGNIYPEHLSNGTLSGYAYAVWTRGSHGDSYKERVPVSGSVGTNSQTLTTIARASGVSATNADIGSSSTISIDRKSSDFTTTLSYSFGSLSDTIVNKTTQTSYSWTIPTTFYAQIKDNPSGVCTISAKTYSGNTQIGDTKTTTITVTANENLSKPTVGTPTVVDVNPTTVHLTSSATATTSNVIVKGYSTARISATRSTKNSSTLKYFYLNDVNVGTTATTRDITKVGTNVFTARAVDSRSYSTTTTTTKTGANYIEYVPIQYTATFTRNSPTNGQIDIEYDGVWFNASFGRVTNTLTVKYRYKEATSNDWVNWITLSPTIIGNTFNQSITIGDDGSATGMFDYTKKYDFQLLVIDELNTDGTLYVQTITQSIPTFWWDEDFHVEHDLYVVDNQTNNSMCITGSDITQNGSSIVGYASPSSRGGINMRVDGTTLYIRNDGRDA